MLVQQVQYNTMSQYVMAFRKFDPRQEYFDPVISALIDSGITEFYLTRKMPHARLKWHQDKVAEEKISLEHYYTPMAIFGAGVLTATAAVRQNIIEKYNKRLLLFYHPKSHF